MLRFMSWNINEAYLNKLPVLNDLISRYSAIFIKERFISKLSMGFGL